MPSVGETDGDRGLSERDFVSSTEKVEMSD